VSGRCAVISRCLLALGIALVAHRPVVAQDFSGVAAVDSAAVARAAFARASAALRRDDAPSALVELRRASSAWPAQPSYPWALARVAATAGDTATVFHALEQLRRLDVPRALGADPVLGRIVMGTRFAALLRWNDSTAHAPTASTVFRAIADSTLWPEGAECTPTASTCWVSGIATQRIHTIASETRVASLLAEQLAGPVTAIRYDAARRLLWASTSSGIGPAPRMSQAATLVRIDVVAQRVTGRWELPDTGGVSREHVLGDIAVAADGDVIVSDSRTPTLYLLHDEQLSAIRDPHFRSLQGIAVVPDSPHLIVADYSHGLLRVDRRTHHVQRLGDPPTGTALGVDGLSWYRGSLIGVQNGVVPARIVRFSLDAGLSRLTAARTIDRNNPLADEPTGGTIVGDAFVYLSSSSWDKYDDDGARIAARPLRSPVLLRVPLQP
jgi:hypothetical protein